MKKLSLVLTIALLAAISLSCSTITIPTTVTVSALPVTVTATEFVKETPEPLPPVTVTVTLTPTPTTTTPIKTTTAPPTTTPPATVTPIPTTTITNLGTGFKKYDMTNRMDFYNSGPGTVTKLEVKVALATTTAPYQAVNLTDYYPANVNITTDAYGNTYGNFTITNVAAGATATVQIHYTLTANEVKYNLVNGTGALPAEYLKPEKWIESDDPAITALAAKTTAGKTGANNKARAIYDWVGDNINYLGYQGEIHGAKWALDNLGGDCTEFACLMAALCRAVGIPARFVEGIGYVPNSEDTPKHDWTEIYLPGNGWVPVDATWGRYQSNRELYWAGTTPDHIKLTTGNPAVISGDGTAFGFMRYTYWYNEAAEMTLDEKWDIYCQSKPDTLLCSDAEYERLRAVYESWGWDFNSGYEKYSREGYDNNWAWFWMGSTEDESRKLYFDRSGNKWKPRNIP